MHCLIVDDHPVTLLGLNLIVKNHFPEWTVTTATTIQEAMTSIHAPGQPVDVLLMDLMLNDQNGMTLLMHIQQANLQHPLVSIVVSGSGDAKTIELCKSFGASGFVTKNDAPTVVAQAIRDVISGREYFPVHKQTPSEVRINNFGGSVKLTERQRDIIDLVLAGYSNKKIADTLNISCGTVKNYMFDLMRLFSVQSRLELAIKIQSSNYQSRSAALMKGVAV
ncbi:MAG TPA: response regulator transcription factor [Noviherbaspirillum sp.]|nr:response regulator transcription factor [Noviherbaspirillum sp.]